ncbi:MAG: helix-turn-helix domain-containing protein [Treponema sp.]|nr:helix-turn-helix domain-containing protein [Treponema sp.]
MKQGRPYPLDKERRVRVKTELAKNDMTISDLARAINIVQPVLSEIINGVRRSKKTEERIAAFFRKSREELFPSRTKKELADMRENQKESA